MQLISAHNIFSTELKYNNRTEKLHEVKKVKNINMFRMTNNVFNVFSFQGCISLSLSPSYRAKSAQLEGYKYFIVIR